jgi:hypothetical protein
MIQKHGVHSCSRCGRELVTIPCSCAGVDLAKTAGEGDESGEVGQNRKRHDEVVSKLGNLHNLGK